MYERMIKRASAVIEALPYLQEFYGKTIVIKYGGAAMTDPELKRSIMRDVVLLRFVGMLPVIVHGGGPRINRYLKRKRIKFRFKQGLRVTNRKVMRAVEHVLGHMVNSEIVHLIKKNGGRAKGFYGKKGKVIKAQKLWLKSDGRYHDLGFTGKVVDIRYRFLRKWMKKGYIPVLSPIGVGSGGKTYNINADQAAAAVASQMGAAKLILITNVRGVLDKDEELVSEIDANRAQKMIRSRRISGGMIPKVQSGLLALKKGVEKVHIIDGRIPHALLLELFTDTGIGTMVIK